MTFGQVSVWQQLQYFILPRRPIFLLLRPLAQYGSHRHRSQCSSNHSRVNMSSVLPLSSKMNATFSATIIKDSLHVVRAPNVTETFTCTSMAGRKEEVRGVGTTSRGVCNSTAAAPCVHTWFLHYIMWTACSLPPSISPHNALELWRDCDVDPKFCLCNIMY